MAVSPGEMIAFQAAAVGAPLGARPSSLISLLASLGRRAPTVDRNPLIARSTLGLQPPVYPCLGARKSDASVTVQGQNRSRGCTRPDNSVAFPVQNKAHVLLFFQALQLNKTWFSNRSYHLSRKVSIVMVNTSARFIICERSDHDVRLSYVPGAFFFSLKALMCERSHRKTCTLPPHPSCSAS